MSYLAYEVLYDDLSNGGGKELKQLARAKPRLAAKLTRVFEQFVTIGASAGHRIAPELRGGSLEVYLLPRPADLARISTPVALVRINHTATTIEIIKVAVEYMPSEGDFWEQLVS